MPPIKQFSAVVLSTLFLAACGSDGNAPLEPDAAIESPDAAIDARPVPSEISEYLATVPGLTFNEVSTVYNGYRRFELSYTQPLDHADPAGKTFVQRAVLHHRERSQPLVLHTSGYYLFSDDSLAELSVAMTSNQLDVEQRFFGPSSPSPLLSSDWDMLRIEQAATDQHRFVNALSPYYNKAWLNTGHSKGGMTSIYHRRFFPDDVDATVAYVAPISFAAGDTRYHSFFDGVADAACRQALQDVQRQMLTRRAQLLSRLEAAIAGTTATFDRVGGTGPALEDAIVGMPWSFFQRGTASNCGSIPGAGASDDQLFNFLSGTGGFSSDSDIAFFSTYYFQAEAELGYPSIPTTHIDDLLQFTAIEGDFLPTGATATYDSSAMPDVDQWLKSEGSNVLFVYGEFDPWYGGAFELGAQTSDSFKLVVDDANHGALIRDLNPADRETALSAIERWTGVRPSIGANREFLRPELPTVQVRMHMRR